MKATQKEKKTPQAPQFSELRKRLDKLKETSNRWGGARSGAGRPSSQDLGKGPAKVSVGFRLTEEYADLVESQRQEGESLSQAARRLLMEALKSS